eukprot:TRINITY_DN1961_c0_g2_i3.p1 TRINITY_DN1961_c0_g2~~TRINITY_DN1961_c0_g2_i3.p1  ORF type:complete len:641 (+),score=114.94 TRINITY_DN1961_c0_g2_i3:46-1923(+)
MEVLIRLIGADEHMYTNYMDAMQWLEHTDVLEMIVDKFSSSDSPEVHANAAETLCAITRYAPPWLAAKISSPSFVERLFRHALEDSRPKSVLVHSLSVCISLLDPKRFTSNPYHAFRGQMTHGSSITASPETVDGMLESLGDLLKLLDVSSAEIVLPTTYGKLQPPLGKHRLKTVEFISVLLMIGNEAAEKQLIQLGAIQRILDLFFEYPFNNFLHHHVENIIVSCLESKKALLIEHLLKDCYLVGKILQAEKNFTLSTDSEKPTVPTEERLPPRIGNIGHMTRISNKLVQLANDNSEIQTYLQENNDWIDWHTNVLLKRNTVENVNQWACGRPTAFQDRTRDSDDEDFRDRDYDVAALASNLSQAFRYGIYSNDDEEAHGSIERDDEDVYFDDECAEVVISSLRLGDDQDSGSLFTNSNWFAFEDDRTPNELSTDPIASPSPNTEETNPIQRNSNGDIVVGEDDDLADTATSSQAPENGQTEKLKEDARSLGPTQGNKPPEWVEWRETSDSGDPSNSDPPSIIPNGGLDIGGNDQTVSGVDTVSPESGNVDAGSLLESDNENPTLEKSESLESGNENPISDKPEQPESGNENPSSDNCEVSGPSNENPSTDSSTIEDVANEAEK